MTLGEILSETDAYQEILEEGREEILLTFQQTFVDVVQMKFPELKPIASEKIVVVKEAEVLGRKLVEIMNINTVEGMSKFLLALSED